MKKDNNNGITWLDSWWFLAFVVDGIFEGVALLADDAFALDVTNLAPQFAAALLQQVRQVFLQVHFFGGIHELVERVLDFVEETGLLKQWNKLDIGFF